MSQGYGGYYNDFPVAPPAKKKRAKIGLPDAYGGNYYAEDLPGTAGGITEEKREELLAELTERAPQFTSSFLELLGRPTSYVLDAATGRQIGSGTTGEQALEQFGFLPNKDALGGWARPIASAGLEMAIDPLNLITFGSGAVTKAGRAARAANLFDDAQMVASRQLLKSGRPVGKFGDNALAAFSKHYGKSADDLTDADLIARPLVGPRETARSLSLEDLVNYKTGSDRTKAIADLDDYLYRKGSSYQSVAKQKLGGDIGVRLPFGDTSWTVNVPFLGGPTARGLDRIGQAIRWSPVGRYAMSHFSNSVMGTVDEGDQILAKQLHKVDKAADAAASQATAEMLYDLPKSAYDPKAGTALRNVIEGTASAAENNLVNSDAGLKNFVSKWKSEAKDYIARSRKAGIGSAELKDAWGTEYFPRSLDENNFAKAPGFQNGLPRGGRQYSVMTGDQLTRDEAFKTPGGTKVLQALSLDKNVAGPNRLLKTDREAGDYIKKQLDDEIRRRYTARTVMVRTASGGTRPELQYFDAKGNRVPAEFSQKQAIKIARMLNQMKPEGISAGHPIFGQHVASDLARYYKGRERAMARANALYDILGSTAKNEHYLDVADGMHTSLDDALQKLQLKSTAIKDAAGNIIDYEGAKGHLIERLSKRFGRMDIDELKNISVDKKLLDRLNRIADFYEVPEVQSKILKFLDDFTRMWKGSILSWPARFLRDWYSGGFSNIVEVGNFADLMDGYSGARHLLQGNWDELDRILQRMPRYRNMAPDLRRRQFLSELAGGGLLKGKAISDIGQATTDLASGTSIRDEMLPGISPKTTLGWQVRDAATLRFDRVAKGDAAYYELMNAKNWGNTAKNVFKPKTWIGDGEVTHPILRWSAKLGDNTDSINRLSGYIGLLKQGVSPLEAARRIKLSQVDYDSLTKVERSWLRRVIPFWAYTSRISSYTAKHLWDNPGGAYFQFGIRLPERIAEADQDEGYVPTSIRQRYGFSLDPLRRMPGVGPLVDYLAPEQKNVSAWLADIDLPGIDQLNTLRIQSDLDGNLAPFATASETAKEFAGSNLHPFLKTGVELMTGIDLYTGRSKVDSEATLQALGRRSGQWEKYSREDKIAGAVDPFFQLVPFLPRGLQLARRAVDSERVPSLGARVAQNAFNAFTGVKVQNISDDVRRQDALAKIEQLIGDSPDVRTMERTYIPKEAIPYADPDVLDLYSLQQQLDKEKRFERKMKAQAQQQGYYYQ